MSCLVDVTVLLSAAEPTRLEHDACYALLERLREGPEPWYLTWQIVNELYRYGTDPRVLKTPWSTDILHAYVEGLQRSPFLRMLVETQNHLRVAGAVLKEHPWVRGELLRHFQVAVLMREHGVERIYTNDRRFNRFRFLRVVSPLH